MDQSQNVPSAEPTGSAAATTRVGDGRFAAIIATTRRRVPGFEGEAVVRDLER
jgi:hypothetical protein